MRIAVFASGTGSNFTAIADAIQANEIKGAQIGLVFSDKPAAQETMKRLSWSQRLLRQKQPLKGN